MKIPFKDLSVLDQSKKRKLLHSVDQVLSHGRIILGPEVISLEQKIATMCNQKYAVGVNSGTDALYMALRSINITQGDEVITTPLSWIATVNAIVLCGAKPVFADIKDDLNINPKRIPDLINKNTKAILPVHFTGNMCQMDKILKCAQENDIYVVEDAAQAFGAKYNNQIAGSFGIVNSFSLNPMKNLCGYGEAGIVVTNDKNLNEKLLSLRYAGTVNKEDCIFPGLNGRIDTIQAAMIMVELEYFDEKIKRIREISRYYTNRLKTIVSCPLEDDNSFHTYYSYTIVTDHREELIHYLNNNGIETKIQHPILMPYHSAYKERYQDCNIPNAERMVSKILCLPNHEKMSDIEVEYVASKVEHFYR